MVLYCISLLKSELCFLESYSMSGSMVLIFYCDFLLVSLVTLKLCFSKSLSLYGLELQPAQRIRVRLRGGHETAASTCWMSPWLEEVSDGDRFRGVSGSLFHTLFPPCVQLFFPTVGPAAHQWSQKLALGTGGSLPQMCAPATLQSPMPAAQRT